MFNGMTARENKNARSASTTWSHAPDRIPRRPPGGQQNVPKAPRWWALRRRNGKDALTIRITYRGGAQCWYLVEARGTRGAFPGVLALHDVMREINEGREHLGDRD